MMKIEIKLFMALAFFLVGSLMLSPVMAAGNGGGFDEYGYNYQARVFVGKADGVDRVLDGGSFILAMLSAFRVAVPSNIFERKDITPLCLSLTRKQAYRS
jgi:preprotein translocase subunit SecG